MDGISYNRSLCRLSHFLFIFVLFSSIPLICRLESSFYSISHSISYRLGFLPFLFFHYCRKFSSFPFSPSNSKSTKSERVFIPHVSQFPQLYHHPTNLNNEERNVIREKERKKKEKENKENEELIPKCEHDIEEAKKEKEKVESNLSSLLAKYKEEIDRLKEKRNEIEVLIFLENNL